MVKTNDDGGTLLRGEVLAVDNSNVTIAGMSAIGTQKVTLRMQTGKDKGQEKVASNILLGQLDMDQFYEKGDHVIVSVTMHKNKETIRCVEMYRSQWLLVLFILFIVILIAFAKETGLRALLSFIITFFILWKGVIPLLLAGANPLLMTVLSLCVISAVILFTVAGLTVKGVTALVGTLTGLLLTGMVMLLIGNRVGLMGMSMPYAQSILFGGYFDLNMRDIFYATILIGSSGAAMDIGMDVASSCHEIQQKHPLITRKELFQSGIAIGRDVVGTMTTTLLLAYSGGYLSLLMMFQLRGTSMMQMMNMKIVAAELMRILVGSIGLLLVAPTTAFMASLLMVDRTHALKEEKEDINT